MFNTLSRFILILSTSVVISQTGHLMQGVGAINMSMGGAATAQPLDISGAMHWNPAALSVFDGTKLKLDVGGFFSSPILFSSADTPEGFVSGFTEDDKDASIMPALALAWGKEDSNHTFGISAFGISGFGVTFPENSSNPIGDPQRYGFGHIESNYMLLQLSLTWAYSFSDKFSIGLQPNFNYAKLELEPNPLAQPGPTGYPKGDAEATGFGGQVGLFYDSKNGIKLGVSYKTPQKFSKMDFGDGTRFAMDYPAIYSIGLGYSKGIIDLALDYRFVDYESTAGFKETGWTQFGSIKGFGWQNISIVSAGLQLRAFSNLPVRFGYTYSTNPIKQELAMFSVPATAIIAHAFQFGLSYEVGNNFSLDFVYHYGTSDGKTSGNMLNPFFVNLENPLGEIPGSEVAYEMTTSMIMIGLNFTLGEKDTDKDGVKDKDDICPEIAGLSKFNGCPDSDGDGIQDINDRCLDEFGLAEFNGCPDTDHDGFSDNEDLCPNLPGLEQFNGCPDTDGDGVMDSKDECPKEAGLVENKGCPLLDKDGDGVVDDKDNCPDEYGNPTNNGCPILTEAIEKEITDLIRAVYFETGRTSLTKETVHRLDEISKILANYKASEFVIEGHTDNTGTNELNNRISQKRAEAVMNFLIANGFPEQNIKAKGYGSTNPIGDNKSIIGRQKNRRVEISSVK